MASMNNLKLSNKETSPYKLDDAKKGYKVTGTTGVDNVVLTENTKTSSFKLNKGADEITFPKALDAYKVAVDKKGANITFTDKVSKQAFSFALDNKDLDKFTFKDGFATLGIVKKSVQFGKFNLEPNKSFDLKDQGSKIGLTPMNNNASQNITLKILGADTPQGIILNEDNQGAFVTAQLSSPLKQAITFQVNTEDITAQSTVDYKPLNQKFTISANKTEVKIPLALINDTNKGEIDEQFALKITNVSNSSVKLLQDKVTITIHDMANTGENTTPTQPTDNTGGNTTPTQPTDNTGGNTTPTQPTDNTGGNTTPTQPTDNTGGNTIPTGNTLSIDGKGNPYNIIKLDAGTGAFNFTDDVAKENNVEISNFSADDQITIIGSNANQYDNNISSTDQSVTITYNNNGQVNTITLLGVVTEKDFIYDVASFNNASIGNIHFQ